MGLQLLMKRDTSRMRPERARFAPAQGGSDSTKYSCSDGRVRTAGLGGRRSANTIARVAAVNPGRLGRFEPGHRCLAFLHRRRKARCGRAARKEPQ